MRVCVAPKGELAMLVIVVQRHLGVLAVLQVYGDEQPIAALGPEHGWLQWHG